MPGAISIDFKTSATPCKHPPPSALLSYPTPGLLFQPVNHLLYLQLTCKMQPQRGLSPLARRKGSSPGGAGSCLPMQWSVRGWGWPSPGSALQALSSGAPTHGHTLTKVHRAVPACRLCRCTGLFQGPAPPRQELSLLRAGKKWVWRSSPRWQHSPSQRKVPHSFCCGAWAVRSFPGAVYPWCSTALAVGGESFT